MFADQASRTVEVPNVPNSIEIWQTFRDEWSVRGDLRQELGRRRPGHGSRQGDRARRPVLTAGPFDHGTHRRTGGGKAGTNPAGGPPGPPAGGNAVRRAVRRVPRRGLRLPAGAGGVDQLPRLLLRGSGRRGRPAVRRAGELPDRPGRPRRAPVVRERGGVPGHQRAADRGAVAGAGLRAQHRHPGTHLPARRLLRALRDRQRRPGRGLAVPLQRQRHGQPAARSRWRRTRPGW